MAGTGSDGTLGGIGKAFLAIAVEITLGRSYSPHGWDSLAGVA
jgi:hypothetical protein